MGSHRLESGKIPLRYKPAAVSLGFIYLRGSLGLTGSGAGDVLFLLRKRVAWPDLFPQNLFARSLRRRGRLIDPDKENPNNKMLKKYTKYAATAFAVASLSTFMIGCGGEADDPPSTEDDDGIGEDEGEVGDDEEGEDEGEGS